MSLKTRYAEIEEKPWPSPIKSRVRELILATAKYREVHTALGKLDMMDKARPALQMDGGRALRRMAETYDALAHELAYHHTSQR